MRRLRDLALAGTVVFAASSPALAVEPEVFAEAFAQAAAASGTEIDYESATGSGETITLTGVEFGTPGGEGFEAGDMVFEGVTENDSQYRVETTRVADLETSEDDVDVTLQNLVIEGLTVPKDPEGDGLDAIMLYDRASAGPMAVSVEGTEVFALDEVSATVSEEDENTLSSSVEASGLEISLATVDDAKTRAALEAMGYESLTGDFSMDLSWSLDSGRIRVSDYALTIDDAGTLGMTLDVSGYTPEFLQSMEEAQEAMEGIAEDDPQARQAAGLAMMALMQQLTFNGLSIRFEDASLTGKLLEYFADQQGTDPEVLVQGLKGMLPLMLGRLDNPEFQEEVADAVGTFLENPQSIAITARPEEPVPFTAIMAAGMAAPQTLPDVLGVSVTANEPPAEQPEGAAPSDTDAQGEAPAEGDE